MRQESDFHTVRRASIAIILTVIIGMIAMTGPAAADDEWPSECDEAPVLSPGSYSGTLSPEDTDVFRVDLPSGDYISINLSFSSSDPEAILRYYVRDGSLSTTNGTEIEADETTQLDRSGTTSLEMYPSNFSFRTYSETNEPICVDFSTGGDHAGDWALSFTPTDETPPPVDATTPPMNVTQQILELQERVETLEQRVTELESQTNATTTPE
ncbi:hypothetical protein [Salinibaculum salinum]|uniref:hypothetical protein n=1 Tax=Salinibaculum salinum TaxID=3131996 RepID=UPI0030EF02E8